MNRHLGTALLLIWLLPGVVLAGFPLALLPGVALMFESGTLAASYAAALALIGGAIAWLYIEPTAPAAGQAVVPKVEVRFKSDQQASMAPGAVFDVDGGIQIPANVVPIRGTRTYSSTTAYNNAEWESRSIQRCTVGAGCTLVHGANLATQRPWLHEAASRYLLFSVGSGAYMVDPHGVASRDGVSATEWGGCPAGYVHFDPATQTCHYPTVDDGARLPSDGICSYVTVGNQLQIDPSLTWNGYMLDPDCDGQPLITSKLEIQDNGKTTTVEMISSDVIKVTEDKLDTTTNKTLRTEYIIEGPSDDRSLAGGTYNNTFNPGSGNGSGGGNNSGGGSTGGNGGEGMTCGGPGQPACSVKVDDNGFSGHGDHSADVSTIGAALDAQRATLEGIAEADIGVGTDWLPNLMPGAQLSCSPLKYEPAITHGPAAGLGGSFELDICDKLAVIREIIGWTIGIFTAIYVFRNFFRSNGGY